MIEAIQVAGIDAATGAAGGTAAAAQPQASAIEVSQFAQAQQQAAGVSQPAQAAGPSAVSGAPEAGPSEATRMVASAIDGLNSNAEKIEALARSIAESDADPTPGQMMEMTMLSHTFLIQSQLTANVANRTSDGVQQLFRQQS